MIQLYRDAAPTLEDTLSLRSRLSSQQALMSKLACHNAKNDDFEKNRVQSVKAAMEELITSIALPSHDNTVAGYIGGLYLIEHLKLTNDSLLQRLRLAELVKKYPHLKQITLAACSEVTVKDIVTVLAYQPNLQLSIEACAKINKAKHWQQITQNCQRFTLVVEGVAFAIGRVSPSALEQLANEKAINTGELNVFLTWLNEQHKEGVLNTRQFLSRQQQQLGHRLSGSTLSAGSEPMSYSPTPTNLP